MATFLEERKKERKSSVRSEKVSGAIARPCVQKHKPSRPHQGPRENVGLRQHHKSTRPIWLAQPETTAKVQTKSGSDASTLRSLHQSAPAESSSLEYAAEDLFNQFFFAAFGLDPKFSTSGHKLVSGKLHHPSKR